MGEGRADDVLRVLAAEWAEQLLADRFVAAYESQPAGEDEAPTPPDHLDPWEPTNHTAAA